MAIKKNIAVWLGVIYDFQMTNRKQGRLQQEPPPPWHTPIGHLGVIYDSRPARMEKNTTRNRWML